MTVFFSLIITGRRVIWCFILTDFAVLKRQLRRSQRSAYSEGTFKNFKTQIKSYLLFCEYFHIESMPVSVETLCLYIQFLGRSMKSAQSVRNYLNGVKLYHILNDAEFPSLQDFQIKLTLRGLGKVLFHTPKQAAPFTPDILTEIWRVVDFFNPMLSSIWCAFVFAFFMMARKSSIAPKSVLSFDPTKYLCRKRHSVNLLWTWSTVEVFEDESVWWQKHYFANVWVTRFTYMPNSGF